MRIESSSPRGLFYFPVCSENWGRKSHLFFYLSVFHFGKDVEGQGCDLWDSVPSWLSQIHVALKVWFLTLNSFHRRARHQERWDGDLFTCQPFTCSLPHFGTRICFLGQNGDPNTGRLPAHQSQPQVAKLWLRVVSHPAAVYSRCCGAESNLWPCWWHPVSLWWVFPFFGFFLILSTLTASLNKQLKCDEWAGCYVHGF